MFDKMFFQTKMSYTKYFKEDKLLLDFFNKSTKLFEYTGIKH